MLAGKRILLIISGGIAAYKTLELIRRLRERGATVDTILTAAAKQFVTPLSVGALSNGAVYDDLFDLTAEREIGHIRLSRQADLLVVAPASADLLARMANGLADDFATAALLATDKPVLVAPAMNPRMWAHPATRRNVERLERDGVHFVGPNSGEMAESGEAGLGRMPEPHEIFGRIAAMLGGRTGPLAGRRVIVTSGPTHEPIDPVRYFANRSSGRQGHAIAAAAAAAGAEVVLVSGPVGITDPAGVTVVRVETAKEMLAAVEAALPADIAIFAAAVADWRAEGVGDQKIKKTSAGAPPALRLVENPDILATVARRGEGRPRLVVGFAAETDDVDRHAAAKRERKGADWIVANDVRPQTGVMGGTMNTVRLVTAEGVEGWPKLAKEEVAERLVARIATVFETGGRGA